MKPLVLIFVPGIYAKEPIDMTKISKEILKNYHILFIVDENREVFDAKVFSDKEIKPIELDELKKLCKVNDKRKLIIADSDDELVRIPTEP